MAHNLNNSTPESSEGTSSTPTVDSGLSDEIDLLKKKILELEVRQSRSNGADPPEPPPDPNVIAQMEQFKRMESCLYNHRKEWELNEGPGKLELGYGSLERYGLPRILEFGEHKWVTSDVFLRGERKYHRPDPFDPAHECNRESPRIARKDAVEWDEYDMTIDWGNRRDRLRKTFEWEMDRLFLKEELQHKKEEELKAADDKKRRERRMAETGAQLSGEHNLGETGSGITVSKEPKVAWLDWYSFKRIVDTDEKSISIFNVIDILIGEPVIDDDIGTKHLWYGYSGSQLKKSKVQSTGQKPLSSVDPARLPTDVTKSQVPERIRIHSEILLRILGSILGSNGAKLFEVEDPTSVFIRPYKALVYREEALRDWCKALEKKFRRSSASKRLAPSIDDDITSTDEQTRTAEEQSHQHDRESVPEATQTSSTGDSTQQHQEKSRIIESLENQPRNSDSEDDTDESEDDKDKDADEKDKSEGKTKDLTKSLLALEHLRCLVKFLDDSVGAKRDYLNSPECRKVFFSDLWYLFRPGVDVIGSDGRQAYRIIGVTSAKHRIAPIWERWYNPTSSRRTELKKPDFSITCVYIDFDGKHIGPVQKTFDFKRFDGQREIASMEVYPLRFHPIKRSEYNDAEWQKIESYPVQERYRQKLIRRGAKFLDVVGGKHMYYAGTTIDEKDDVESPVVIDFETTFTMHDIPQRNLAPQNLPPPLPDDPFNNSSSDLWKPKLTTLIGIEDSEPNSGDIACRGECCRDEFVHDDQYVDRQQRSEYIDTLLPKSNDLHGQPPITIVPRSLKEVPTGADGKLICPDDELVIMSYRVFGFVLRSRKFAKLDLTYLSDIHASEESNTRVTTARNDGSQGARPQVEHKLAFDRLVLEKGHQGMIVSLIAQHFRDKKSMTGQREEFDIVKGKGKGLIILLHGAPGVGKTSTAEGVAEKFKKPLFQITCGDLGTTATEVETALEKNFSLANKWDCILLLDEADVFLTERSKEDFKRNGLVAVFLRLMEYYSGILFLTTNRVGDFDEAFTSRIHVSLYYPALNEDKTVQVFKINLDMIEERFKTKGRTIKIDRMDIGSFATRYYAENKDARWNGRQIRNACQTALALAEFEAQGSGLNETENPDIVVNLRVEHFEIVRNAYMEFTKYMHNLYGTSDARRAKESRLRAIVNDEIERAVKTHEMESAGMDKKNAFFLAAQSQSGRPTGHSPQSSFQQQQSYQQQQQYGRYQQQGPNFGAHQNQYPPSQYQPQQQFSSHRNWDPQQSKKPGAVISQPQHEGQFQNPIPYRQQATPSPNQQQQAQLNSPWSNENVRNMYDPSGQQGNEQTMASASGPGGPGWQCPTCGNFHPGLHPGVCPVCG